MNYYVFLPIKIKTKAVFLKDILALHSQYRIRSHGDNGLTRTLISLNNLLEVWYQKFNIHVQNMGSSGNNAPNSAVETASSNKKGLQKLSEAEWMNFYQSIDDWIDIARKAGKFIGIAYAESAEATNNL